jgi:hypothetical protein
MNVNLKEKIAQIYARKGTREAPARWRIPLLFLALLMPAIAGQLVAAQDQPGADYALIIDVYSGAVAPDATQEKGFWLWLEALKKTEEPGGLPKVIHIERVLSENDFDFAGEANANGENLSERLYRCGSLLLIGQAHCRRQRASQKPWFLLHPSMVAKTCSIHGRMCCRSHLKMYDS